MFFYLVAMRGWQIFVMTGITYRDLPFLGWCWHKITSYNINSIIESILLLLNWQEFFPHNPQTAGDVPLLVQILCIYITTERSLTFLVRGCMLCEVDHDYQYYSSRWRIIILSLKKTCGLAGTDKYSPCIRLPMPIEVYHLDFTRCGEVG